MGQIKIDSATHIQVYCVVNDRRNTLRLNSIDLTEYALTKVENFEVKNTILMLKINS